jgi:hypothetical protein
VPSTAIILKGIRTGAIAAALALVAAHGASAANQTGLFAGSSPLTFDGMSFTVTQCTFVNGGTSNACAATDQLFLVQGGPGEQVIIMAQNGGGTQVPIFDTFGSATAGTYDLNVTVGVSSATAVTADTLELTGSAGNSSDNSKVAVGENITHSNLTSQSFTGVNLTTPQETLNFTFPDTGFLLNKDIGLSAATAVVGDHLVLNDVTQTFTLVVPEPTSAACLITGLVLLGRARRKRSAR